MMVSAARAGGVMKARSAAPIPTISWIGRRRRNAYNAVIGTLRTNLVDPTIAMATDRIAMTCRVDSKMVNEVQSGGIRPAELIDNHGGRSRQAQAHLNHD